MEAGVIRQVLGTGTIASSLCSRIGYILGGSRSGEILVGRAVPGNI